MDKFYNALLETPSAAIPPEDDWYAPLIGDWEFDYLEPEGRKVKGEWFFSEITESTFHWRNVTVQDDGSEKLICEVFAKRV